MSEDRPVLRLFVSQGCRACERAELVIRGCARLQALVELDIIDLTGAPQRAHPGVIGAPTAVFGSEVVALGTPNCEALADRIERILATRGGVTHP